EMDWPVMVDSLNLYSIDVVPVTYAIDESGIVRFVNPTREEFATFVATQYSPAQEKPPSTLRPDVAAVETRVRRSPSAANWLALGEALFLWGGEPRLERAIDAFERAVRLQPESGPAHFRLGTALRQRYERTGRRPDDFRRAAEHWTRALEIDPNQYIWRRRLQQYGPRLDKPYPFYDWVNEARRDIRARGESPVPLGVEPLGTEIAVPAKSFEAAGSGEEPDPRGRIVRDRGKLVLAEAAAVPPRIGPGKTTRVHLSFRPNANMKAHWNNEVDPLRVWVSTPEGWAQDKTALVVPNPRETLSTEPRELQFELRGPLRAVGPVTVPLYALYYVCEDVDGTCLYRRQDLSVTIGVRK
ncbi:MAG: tetratricopeptide repeat protein, partial [Burkholderiales bacterium]